MTWRREIVLLGIMLGLMAGCQSAPSRLTFCCSGQNDLYRLVSASDHSVRRFDDALQAVENAPAGSGLLVMADGYPAQRARVNPAFYARANEKHLRLYIEYPSMIPDLKLGDAQKTLWERGVVSSDSFGTQLPKNRIVAIHGCQFLPVNASDPLLVVARVAGYDTAVYGLPANSHPILFAANDGNWLIATTNLSNFITARYAPRDDWRIIWQFILARLDRTVEHLLQWQPTVHPAYTEDEDLPGDVERRAFASAANWYKHARLLVSPSRKDAAYSLLASGAEAVATPSIDDEGDGSLGILEGYASPIAPDGSQSQRLPLRADCNAESAMVLALDNNDESRAIAKNLLDFTYSPTMQGRERLDPAHPAFGLIAWGAIAPNWQVANYGDDNARTILATLAASAGLKTDRWNAPVLRALLANLRTTGKNGFRGDRIDIPALSHQAWKAFHDSDVVNYSPHFESYLWTCYLWTYHHTHEKEFLDRARNAISMTVAVYPGQWRWQDNNERSRMLLCLSWLVRVDDTPEHRTWLTTVARDLLQSQQPCGAIQERLATTGGGHYQIPQSNEAYGTGETPLIQHNGDPASDQLYTAGFALLGLHEAAAATNDPSLKQAEDKLAEFLCRIQIRSHKHPYLNGTWFRAFDNKRWDYFASSADAGWGAWSIETGWAQAWTAATLGLRERNTTLWDLTETSAIGKQLPAVQKDMSINDGAAPAAKP